MRKELKNILFNGSLEEKDRLKIKDIVIDNNRKNLSLYSSLSILFFGLAFIISFIVPAMDDKRIIYIFCVLGGFICICLNKYYIDQHPNSLQYILWAFDILFIGTGAAMSLCTCQEETAVLYPVMISLVPLLFTDLPIHILTIEEIVNVIYILGTICLRPQPIWGLEIVNAISFSSIGLIIGIYMTIIKLQRHLFEINTLELIDLRNKDALTDQLTGLPNRRAFYEDLEKDNPDLIIVSTDITGLKQVNDTYGHQAGDILINGAASLLTETFSTMGKVYRVGGDEFLLILHGKSENVETLIQKMKVKENEWKSSFQNGLHIAIGYACNEENMPLEKLVFIADQKMYEDKSNWYKTNGVNRRKR